jgi:hypothetical protein
MTRSDQLLESFVKFHKANPQVWLLFRKFTLQLIEGGRTHYSADAIIQRVRWDIDNATSDEPFKINDHATCFFARLFQVKYPEHRGFFRTRHRPSESRAERPDALEFGQNAEVEMDPELEKVLKEL